MGAKDIIKNKVIEAFTETDTSIGRIILVMGIACLLACYIYGIYRITTRKTFYSKSFNISLAVLTVITAGVILTIQSSIVVSLGMVGALSIVRFRTAVKDPMDLIFLFWAIAVGIICGAGLFKVGIILTLLVTVLIFVLDKIPLVKVSKILIINSREIDTDDAIEKILKKNCSSFKLKSRNITAGQTDLIYEIKTVSEKEKQCMKDIWNIEGIIAATCMEQEGETTF